MAGPWLVLTLALPVAMQTDRLLLSHLSTPTELAEYGLAFSLFSLLSRRSARPESRCGRSSPARTTGEVRSPFGMGAAFGVVAALAAVVLALLLPVGRPVVSGGAVRLDAWVTWAFVALVVVQAANYPLGMYMTDAPVCASRCRRSCSWSRSTSGCPGPGGDAAGRGRCPVVGSAVAVALCQLAPGCGSSAGTCTVAGRRAPRRPPSGEPDLRLSRG